MAEVLAVVTSGFAVASLALELVEVVQKLHRFWQRIVDTESEIDSIRDHLETLCAISTIVAEMSKTRSSIASGKAVLTCLTICKSRIDKLSDIAQESTFGMDTTKKRKCLSIMKMTLKRKTIAGIEAQLRRDIMMLLLALQPFYFEVQQFEMMSLSSKLAKFPLLSVAGLDDLGDMFQGHDDVSMPDTQDLITDAPHHWHPYPGQSEMATRPSVLWCSSTTIDIQTIVETILLPFGFQIPPEWRKILKHLHHIFTYMSSTYRVQNVSPTQFHLEKRSRIKIRFPLLRGGYQIHTCNFPLQVRVYPMISCQSAIFRLCSKGDQIGVASMLSRGVSPFVTNGHGQNLLHFAAKYAHVELCSWLLFLGVEGNIYDDDHLTPLDHLARMVPLNFHKPARVVDTIRLLVERGRCTPLISLSGNTVPCYHGPEEGFAWLFKYKFTGLNLEQLDPGGWTLLGDAAFSFGRMAQRAAADVSARWQSLYLLRSGADPHKPSAGGLLTPLDAYLRGATVQNLDHANKWLHLLHQAGIDLHTYGKREEALQNPEHLLKSRWDHELQQWIPVTRRVLYAYGTTPTDLQIWLEECDALAWFADGRYDLDIFDRLTPSASRARWRDLNGLEKEAPCLIHGPEDPAPVVAGTNKIRNLLDLFYVRLLTMSLVAHYLLYQVLQHYRHSS